MTRYFYILYEGQKGLLIEADKLKRALFQVEKLYNVKNKKLLKSVEISKEVYDRLILWKKLKEDSTRRKANESSVQYLKRMGVIQPVKEDEQDSGRLFAPLLVSTLIGGMNHYETTIK